MCVERLTLGSSCENLKCSWATGEEVAELDGHNPCVPGEDKQPACFGPLPFLVDNCTCVLDAARSRGAASFWLCAL